MTALIRPGCYASEAQAAWSDWEARCGACRYGAERLRRFQSRIVCRVCGQVTEVIWPTEWMVKGIERLLMMRPDPTTRNWYPGETLHDLLIENGAHGVLDNALEMEPGAVKFSVIDHDGDGWVQVDNLLALPRQKRKSIGP